MSKKRLKSEAVENENKEQKQSNEGNQYVMHQHICCFDYNVMFKPCAYEDCPYICVYHDDGQEDAGQSMKCKKYCKGLFCDLHRVHEKHDGHVIEEDSEEEIEDDE